MVHFGGCSASRTIPKVYDIKTTVVEVCNIARRELGPSHFGNGRDLCIRMADGSAERQPSEFRRTPKVTAIGEPSIPKAAQHRRRRADVLCHRATPRPGRVTLCVSVHLGTRESQSRHLLSPDCPP